MYDTILVPLDGSERAEAILRHVEDLARRCGARVVLMQVVEPVLLAADLLTGSQESQLTYRQQEIEQRVEEAKCYLSDLQDEFEEKGIEAQVRVAHGPIVEAIIHTAEQEGADLVAMASHGRTGLAQVFYGSVAAGVLHRIDRPLLIVRSQR